MKPIVFILLWGETQGGHGTLFCNLSAWKQQKEPVCTCDRIWVSQEGVGDVLTMQ